MKTLVNLAVVFCGILSGVVVTSVTHGCFWCIMWLGCVQFGFHAYAITIATVLTFAAFIAGFAAAWKRSLPGFSTLRWDSGAVEDTPSKIYVAGRGGALWNMNPLGPNSIRSMTAVGAAILCLGPAILIGTFVAGRPHAKGA